MYNDYTMNFVDQDDYMKGFGKKIRGLLKVKKMTQLDLSEATGLDVTMISKYIRGIVVPSLYRAYRIASVLGCSLDDIAGCPVRRTK